MVAVHAKDRSLVRSIHEGFGDRDFFNVGLFRFGLQDCCVMSLIKRACGVHDVLDTHIHGAHYGLKTFNLCDVHISFNARKVTKTVYLHTDYQNLSFRTIKKRKGNVPKSLRTRLHSSDLKGTVSRA
jgi:hypothetical protein